MLYMYLCIQFNATLRTYVIEQSALAPKSEPPFDYGLVIISTYPPFMGSQLTDR